MRLSPVFIQDELIDLKTHYTSRRIIGLQYKNGQYHKIGRLDSFHLNRRPLGFHFMHRSKVATTLRSIIKQYHGKVLLYRYHLNRDNSGLYPQKHTLQHNKQHQRKEQLGSFPLNGRLGFHPQTQKLEPHFAA